MEKEAFGSARTIKIAAALLVAALLQASLPQYIGWGVRYIDWLLLVVVYLGLQQRNYTIALLTATAAGIIKDFSSGAGVFAISGIAYLVSAYLADRISSIIMIDNLPIRFGTVAAASVLNTVIQLLGYQMLGLELTGLSGQEGILAMIVLSVIGNLMASVVTFQVLDRIFQATTGLGLRRTQAMRSMRRRKYRVKS